MSRPDDKENCMDGETATAQPWWQRLPEDFYRSRSGTDLDADHRFLVHGSAALDRALRTGLACVTAVLGGGALWRGKHLQRQRELLHFYQRFADQPDPSATFPAPNGAIPVHRTQAPRRMFQPKGVPCELLSFDSHYQPLCPGLAATYGRHRRNRVAYAQYWRHPGRARPTLIFNHGYFASGYALNSWGFSLRWFYKQGYDIVLYKLPFHGPRRDWQHLFNGQGYFGEGLAHMNESMRHAVHDVRVLINFLQAEGAPSVGMSGLSMGGYVTALTASVDDRLAFAIPNSPLVAPIDMLLEWQPIGTLLKIGMRSQGIGIEELRHGTAFHSPLTYKPAIDPDRLMVIGGAGDRFTAPRFVRLLHDHWQGSHMHWFPGNHIVHLQQAAYLRLMKTFMDRHVGF